MLIKIIKATIINDRMGHYPERALYKKKHHKTPPQLQKYSHCGKTLFLMIVYRSGTLIASNSECNINLSKSNNKRRGSISHQPIFTQLFFIDFFFQYMCMQLIIDFQFSMSVEMAKITQNKYFYTQLNRKQLVYLTKQLIRFKSFHKT